MTEWSLRSIEERNLLNPSFCSTLIWHSCIGYSDESQESQNLPIDLAFLILPFILHRETRDSLPRGVVTSFAVWLNNNPLARTHIATRAQLLVPYTREAIIFAGASGFLSFQNSGLSANKDWKKNINKTLRKCSEEVRYCTKRAEFLGKWFAKTGSSLTVLAFLGIKP